MVEPRAKYDLEISGQERS